MAITKMWTSREWSVFITNHNNAAGKAVSEFSATKESSSCAVLKTSMLTSSLEKCFGVIQQNMYQLFFKGWQVCEYIPTTPATVLACIKTKQSHLLVLEPVHYQRTRWEHSWSTALGMTSHTDMSRSYELLHQTSWDGTVPGPLNYTSHIWFWNKDTKLTCNINVLTIFLYATKLKNLVLV